MVDCTQRNISALIRFNISTRQPNPMKCTVVTSSPKTDEKEVLTACLVRWLRTDIWGRAERGGGQILVLSHSKAASAAAPSPTMSGSVWPTGSISHAALYLFIHTYSIYVHTAPPLYTRWSEFHFLLLSSLMSYICLSRFCPLWIFHTSLSVFSLFFFFRLVTFHSTPPSYPPLLSSPSLPPFLWSLIKNESVSGGERSECASLSATGLIMLRLIFSSTCCVLLFDRTTKRR